MSYNITMFKLKSIDLVIPKGFDMHKISEESDEINISSDGIFKYRDGWEGLSFSGKVDEKGNLVVESMDCFGEGSGYYYEDVLKPLLEKCKGSIHCVAIWEGGDSIYSLVAVKGKLTEKEVDL